MPPPTIDYNSFLEAIMAVYAQCVFKIEQNHSSVLSKVPSHNIGVFYAQMSEKNEIIKKNTYLLNKSKNNYYIHFC